MCGQLLGEFEHIYKKYRPGLLNFANSIIRSSEDSTEIVNDVFLAIWEKRETLEFGDNLKSYLFTSVKNRCLNHIKKVRLPFSDMPDEMPIASKDANIEEKMMAGQTQQAVTQVINTLPPKCKQVFLLSRMYELSHKEVAEIMDITPKTVENQIGIALKVLKDAFGKNRSV